MKREATIHTNHLVIVSVFLGEDEVHAWDSLLASLGHRTSLIYPTCDAEIDPPLEGGLTLVEAESAQAASLTVDRQVVTAYQNAYQQYYQQLQRYGEHHGCRFTTLRCEDPLEQQLDCLAPDGVLTL